MQSQLLVRLQQSKKDQLTKISKQLKVSVSDLLRDMVDECIQKHDISAYIDTLWDSISTDLQERTITQEDALTTLTQYRNEKRTRSH